MTALPGAEAVPVLRTGRLPLRGWREEDLDPFAALNADMRVMEHFPGTVTRAESDAVCPESGERFLEQHHLLRIANGRITGIDQLCTGLHAT